jgi:hypothetical protein
MIIELYIIACIFLVWLGGSAWGIHIIRNKWHVLKFNAAEAIIRDFSIREVSAVIDYDCGEFGKIDKHLHISYQFTIDGKKFLGKDESGWVTNGKGSQLIRDYKKNKGDKITIFYNPDNPKENYLNKQYAITGFFIIGFSQLFFVLGLHAIDNWII